MHSLIFFPKSTLLGGLRSPLRRREKAHPCIWNFPHTGTNLAAWLEVGTPKMGLGVHLQLVPSTAWCRPWHASSNSPYALQMLAGHSACWWPWKNLFPSRRHRQNFTLLVKNKTPLNKWVCNANLLCHLNNYIYGGFPFHWALVQSETTIFVHLLRISMSFKTSITYS